MTTAIKNKKDLLEDIESYIDNEKVSVSFTREQIELIVSGLRLNRENKRELGAKLIIENHKYNRVKINQLTKDIQNISQMMKELNDLLYGGMLK